MYQYTDFDRQFVRARAAQFRDQLTRNLAGQLGDDEFRPLRLQNGWYIQRHAPMLRVAVPYGELNSRQLRTLAQIAREFDRGYAHFTTRQNVQYNWIPLPRAADVMERLAEVEGRSADAAALAANLLRNKVHEVAGLDPAHAVGGDAGSQLHLAAFHGRQHDGGGGCHPTSRHSRSAPSVSRRGPGLPGGACRPPPPAAQRACVRRRRGARVEVYTKPPRARACARRCPPAAASRSG